MLNHFIIISDLIWFHFEFELIMKKRDVAQKIVNIEKYTSDYNRYIYFIEICLTKYCTMKHSFYLCEVYQILALVSYRQ